MSPPSGSGTTAVEVQERLAAERRGVPFILFEEGDGAQRIVDCAGPGTIVIGRDPHSDVAVTADPEVSRIHAKLERIHNEWTLVDDGLSRNGSFVNERRVRRRERLRDGDVIRVGRSRLRFCDPNPSAITRTAVATDGSPTTVTPAQRRVLVALCRPLLSGPLGLPPSNEQIAAELYLSVQTVRTHLRYLFAAMAIPDLPQNRKRAELARRAIATGVVSEAELER